MNRQPDETGSREYSTADRLHSVAIHLLRMVRIQDLKTGVGSARLSALSVLVFGGPRSLKKLAEIEQVRPPTMSRIVEGLEKDALVRRKVATADRRQIRLEPTAKGRVVLLEARRRRVTALATRLKSLPEEELSMLDQAVMILSKAIENR